MKTLDDIKPGLSAKIEAIKPTRRFGLIKRRLLDLGITPGTYVKVVRRAPLGDPIEIEVRGCHIIIRKEEARAIMVDDEKDITIPLSMAVRGRYIISSISGMGVNSCLSEIGISTGDIIEVVEPGGPVVIAKNGVRLTIGCGMSEKIFVKSIGSEGDR
ncbi:MAG: FeoA domain-containing protein [bacterium]